jgi:hypothetical protein
MHIRNQTTPISSPPSPVPISPSAPLRSSSAQPPRAFACGGLESPFPDCLVLRETWPTVLFGQPRSSPDPQRTSFSCLGPCHMCARKLRAQHQFHEVVSLSDRVLVLTDGLLPINWTLNSPSRGLYQSDVETNVGQAGATNRARALLWPDRHYKQLLAMVDKTNAVTLVLEFPRGGKDSPAALLALIFVGWRANSWGDGHTERTTPSR